jgi:preprotein translocase subunit SecF
MSEQLQDNHEIKDDSYEVEDRAPEKDIDRLLEAHGETEEQEAPKVEAIRETVEQAAETVAIPDLESNEPSIPVDLPPPNKTLKAQSLNQTLKKTREQLPKPQRAFSKVIHQSQVSAISDVTGKTIARPVGLLFGGLFALIGSTIYLFLSYRYHFAYKYIAFSLFFVGGFIIGLIVEFLGKFLKRSKA